MKVEPIFYLSGESGEQKFIIYCDSAGKNVDRERHEIAEMFNLKPNYSLISVLTFFITLHVVIS